MKKMLLILVFIIYGLNNSNAQSISCPGYTFPASVAVTNLAGCGIDVTFFLLKRNGCTGATPVPTPSSVTFSVVGGTGWSAPIPPAWIMNYSPVTHVIMVQIGWSTSGCDGSSAASVQMDGYQGIGNNCWSCGPYVPPGTTNKVLLPTCPSCDPSGTAHVEWEPISGNIIVLP